MLFLEIPAYGATSAIASMPMHRSTRRTNRIARLTSAIVTSLLASVALFHAPPAKASLQGATVTIAVYCCTAPPGPANQTSNTVSGTVPASFPQGSLKGGAVIPVSVDVTAGQVTLTSGGSWQAAGGSFNGYVYTFSGAPAITNVTVDPLTSPALAPTSMTFTSNSISVNVSGLNYPSGGKQILDITTAA
jgi:hypothetical protein